MFLEIFFKIIILLTVFVFSFFLGGFLKNLQPKEAKDFKKIIEAVWLFSGLLGLAIGLWLLKIYLWIIILIIIVFCLLIIYLRKEKCWKRKNENKDKKKNNCYFKKLVFLLMLLLVIFSFVFVFQNKEYSIVFLTIINLLTIKISFS